MLRGTARIVLVLALLLTASRSHAQLFDSLAVHFRGPAVPTASFGSSNSFINALPVKMRGLKLGLRFDKTVKVGVGYNWMRGGFRQTINLGTDELPDTMSAELQYRSVSAFFDYNFHRSRYWDISMPLQFSVGRSYYRYEDADGSTQRFGVGPMVAYEPAMVVIYKPVKFLGAGVGVGYRLVLGRNPNLAERWTSPIYALKFAVYFDELMKVI